MPIAAASAALARHLHASLEQAGALQGMEVEAMTLSQARTNPGHGIALILWRIQPEESAGDTSPVRTASRADPPEGAGMRLRYLLTVRGPDSAAEQAMLGSCMRALERNPVIQSAGGPGDIEAEALVVTLEQLPDETYLRLLDACGDPPPLLLPYMVHSMRLRPGTG
ncbi:MAG: hypothetical protein AVDCRST_MAG27-1443 [uncultured Craurococcus sp.]|uniref:Pvc16 N-terminal domain-containing protein n=1 Tax=uncultured Craurococcus sp. TaxID=1135998 RepID=A0A6J4I3N3_9PROT|nr:MAG: hypothetical protein AVDCRST_MAG27-1443 [uncultured Craurococcus sp.]